MPRAAGAAEAQALLEPSLLIARNASRQPVLPYRGAPIQPVVLITGSDHAIDLGLSAGK